VTPVRVEIAQGEVVVRNGTPLTAAHLEVIQALGLGRTRRWTSRVRGWFLLAVLSVGMLLAWIWRFRPTLWHRGNVLLLIGLLVVGAAVALKVTAGRELLGYFLPTAAIGMVLAILLDASVATIVMALIALIGGALAGSSLEFASYIFLGGLAGILAVRKGDRLQVFVQAGIAVFIANALVVRSSPYWARATSAGSSSCGSRPAVSRRIGRRRRGHVRRARLGLRHPDVFQLLELANPSQPLLRRLLVETPGTYHHSLMVGTSPSAPPRRSARIRWSPGRGLLPRHRQALEPARLHREPGGARTSTISSSPRSARRSSSSMSPTVSTAAYGAKLPKAIIAYIPQHHGTAVMSYFLARARERAAEPYGGISTSEGAKAAAAVDERKFRHAGPKPQSREAALIMLADSVEASVRSLGSRDEPAIRAMVTRIIDERVADGQFDECDLTFRDLEKIKDAFVAQLLGMYHTRIAYPQNTVVELESRRAAAGGGDQPAS
jgi:membrane-associated HD superfamily phosphohydrolase